MNWSCFLHSLSIISISWRHLSPDFCLQDFLSAPRGILRQSERIRAWQPGYRWIRRCLSVTGNCFVYDVMLPPPPKKMSEWWRYIHAWNKFKMIILSRRRISVRQVQVSGAWPAAARAVCSVLIARAAGDVKELEDAVLLWRFGAEDRTAAEPLRTEMRQSTVNCFFWIQFVWSAVAHGDSLSLFHSLTHTRGLRLTEFSILHHFILLI